MWPCFAAPWLELGVTAWNAYLRRRVEAFVVELNSRRQDVDIVANDTCLPGQIHSHRKRVTIVLDQNPIARKSISNFKQLVLQASQGELPPCAE